mgnify:CR=1 FL=1
MMPYDNLWYLVNLNKGGDLMPHPPVICRNCWTTMESSDQLDTHLKKQCPDVNEQRMTLQALAQTINAEATHQQVDEFVEALCT